MSRKVYFLSSVFLTPQTAVKGPHAVLLYTVVANRWLVNVVNLDLDWTPRERRGVKKKKSEIKRKVTVPQLSSKTRPELK